MIGSSLLQTVNYCFCIALASCHTQKTSTFVMNPLNFLRSEVYHLIYVVPPPAEPNSSYPFNFVHLLQQNHQLSDNIVDTWSYLAQTNHVSPDLRRIEILGWPCSCFHKLLFGLYSLVCSKSTVLDYKLPWFDQTLRGEERLLLPMFGFGCHNGTWVGCRFIEL